MVSFTARDLEEKKTELDRLCAALEVEDTEIAGRVRDTGLRALGYIAECYEDYAAQAYLEMLDEAPGSFAVYRHVALGLVEIERCGDAAEVADEAAQLDPSDPAGYLVLGEVGREAGHFAVAALAYREAFALGAAEDAETRLALAFCCLRLRRYEQAADSYERALALGHEGAQARLSLAEAYHALGRHDEAAESCQRSLALDAGSAEAHLLLGLSLLRAGRSDEAVAALRRCVELGGYFDGRLHGALGLAFESLGLHAEAAAAYEASLGSWPRCECCAEALARTREASGWRGDATAPPTEERVEVRRVEEVELVEDEVIPY